MAAFCKFHVCAQRLLRLHTAGEQQKARDAGAEIVLSELQNSIPTERFT